MRIRILVAVVFVPLLFVILFFLPPYAVMALVSLVSAVGACELVRAVTASPRARFRLCIYAAVTAAIIPALILFIPSPVVLRAVVFALVAVIFLDAVISYHTVRELTLAPMAAVLFGGILIPYFLSSIISLRMIGDNGRFYVLIPFIIAFITDGGAYFTGVFFGKRPAFPRVSPKKTVEGAVGGIATGVAAMAIYGVILHSAAGLTVSFLPLLVYGLVGGVITELGDLAFSLIKRLYNVKDYGRLIPGHGGALDRFDSMIFAAPLIHLLVIVFPAF